MYNVLSLFDGISCGQVALQRAGMKVSKYYASEIDKHAITITQKNHPDTLQLGDVTKWREWDLPNIDILFAGFPCQAWSMAGKQKGESDPRGALVHTLIDIWKHYKPKYFLFENVKMKKEFAEYIDNLFGVPHIEINSALVSAQNRVRWYWTNMPNVTQPADREIYLADIIEDDGYFTDRNKSYCIDDNYYKSGNADQYFNKSRRQLVFKGLACDIKGFDNRRRVYGTEGKSPTLLAASGGHSEPKIAVDGLKYRKLAPLECERLQTLPDDYTLVLDENGKQLVSNTQRYKALGNGWTVDVIAYILQGLTND